MLRLQIHVTSFQEITCTKLLDQQVQYTMEFTKDCLKERHLNTGLSLLLCHISAVSKEISA